MAGLHFQTILTLTEAACGKSVDCGSGAIARELHEFLMFYKFTAKTHACTHVP